MPIVGAVKRAVFTMTHIEGETVAGSSFGGRPGEVAPGAGMGR